jgi:hypothetical protein
MNRVEMLAELRALAALELELDQLFSERVVRARQCDVSWDLIAEAVGVAKPTAWRRWKRVEDDARPSRAERRSKPRIVLDAGQARAARTLVDLLFERATATRNDRPWATATRAALDELGLQFESTAVDARETEFRVKSHRLMITCAEPTPDWAGAVRAIVRAPLGPSGAVDREAVLTGSDGVNNDDRKELVASLVASLL